MRAFPERVCSALCTPLVIAMVLASCRKHVASTGDPTAADSFADHRKDLDTVRAMLVADHGLVTDIGIAPFGGVHDAGGKKGSCASQLRSAGFPWKCTGDVVVNDLAEVEAFLEIPEGTPTCTRASSQKIGLA